MKKRKSMEKVLSTIISLEMSKGHLKWKVTDLARISSVSRPLIYFHFGNTKKKILESAMDIIAEEFYGLSPERTEMVKKGRLLDSLRMSHELFLKNPSFGTFYLKWRTTVSPLQKKYLEIEGRYHARLRLVYPHLSEGQITALHAFLHGIVTAPFLAESGRVAAVTWLDQILSNPKR